MEYKKIVKNFKNFLVEQEDECTNTENRACGCVDSSQSNLTTKQIQNFLKKIYGSDENTGLHVTFSGQHGTAGPGRADGLCGQETREFIMKFQEESNLCTDACVGTDTESAMRQRAPDFFKTLGAVEPADSTAAGKVTSVGQTPNTTGKAKQTISPVSVSAGATISIKSANPTPGGYISSGLKPNHHGYHGRYVNPKKNNDDSGIINAVNFQAALSSAPGIVAQSHRKQRQWGNPILLALLIAAAAHVLEYIKNKKEVFGDADSIQLWNVSKKHGGPLYKHSGHQSGLECDIGFYTKNGIPDIERNIVFLEFLLNQKAVESVLLDTNKGPVAVNKMRKWIKRHALESEFPKVMSSSNSSKPQLAPAGAGSHDDHYHIRCHFPDDAPFMVDFVRDEKVAQDSYRFPGAPISYKSANIKIQPRPTGELEKIEDKDVPAGSHKPILKGVPKSRQGYTKLFKKLIALETLADIEEYISNNKKELGANVSVGYVMGTIDGAVKISNKNKEVLYTGASMPKTMAGLAQLITHKNNPRAQMTDCELLGLLTYWSRPTTRAQSPRAPDRRCSKRHWPDSNHVLSNISKNDRRAIIRYKARDPNNPKKKIWKTRLAKKSETGNRRNGKPWGARGIRANFGQVDNNDVKKISQLFGIKKSSFLFALGRNKQTALDTFNFWAGMARMDAALRSSGTLDDDDPLKSFYEQNKKEIKRVILAQKYRSYSTNLVASGCLDVSGHWGKGGSVSTMKNFAFVLPGNDNTYVLSVFTRSKNSMTGLALLNAILYKLKNQMEKT